MWWHTKLSDQLISDLIVRRHAFLLHLLADFHREVSQSFALFLPFLSLRAVVPKVRGGVLLRSFFSINGKFVERIEVLRFNVIDVLSRCCKVKKYIFKVVFNLGMESSTETTTIKFSTYFI